MTRVDITPDKSLIKKLGLVGYSTEQAIAELVDNAIDARIEGKTERVQVKLDARTGQILVSDDGRGMDGKALGEAMTIARASKRDGKLGQFGIGMKSACSALGKKFSVKTRRSGSEYRAEYDEDGWLADEARGWHNFEVSESPAAAGGHGTEIAVSKLNVAIYPNQVSKFKERFGVRYAPYLESGQVQIHVNTVQCAPARPETVDGSRNEIRLDTEYGEVKGHIELLKKRSVRGSYGMHLTKHGRLIRAHEKFGFPAHPETARITGQLSLDFVPVNFNKSAFIEESPEYRAALNAFGKSADLRETLRAERAGKPAGASAESVFEYFGGTAGPGRLKARMGADAASAVLDGIESVRMPGDVPVEVRFSEADGGVYNVGFEDGAVKVTIDKRSPAFRFVKNPLFLLGLIAAEARLVAANPSLAGAMQERNAAVDKFMREWAQGTGEPRDREPNAEYPPGYGLDNDLVEAHDLAYEKFGARFQFTAMSTLRAHLHNLRRPVYTVHVPPGTGDLLAGIVSDGTGGSMAAAANPSAETVEALLSLPRVAAVLAVREYARIRGPSIAPPEKAYVDLVGEATVHRMPISDDQLREVYASMKRRGLTRADRMETCARAAKRASRIKSIIGGGFG